MELKRCRRLLFPVGLLKTGSFNSSVSHTGCELSAWSGFTARLEFSVVVLCLDFLDPFGVASGRSVEFWRREAGRDTTMSRPVSAVNMVWRFRLLAAEALRSLARSIKAAPVEFDRFDRLPKALVPSGDMVLERRMPETDTQRFPLLEMSFSSFNSSRSVGLLFSLLRAIGVLALNETGEAIDLVGEVATGSA